jgi:ribosomal subunit interface protein
MARAGVTNKVSRMFGSIQTKSLLSSSTKRVSNVQSARHAVVPTASAPTGKGAKIIVQGIHLEVTDSIKEYCEQKINKAVSHFDLHDVREVDVRCSARGGEKQVQCCVSQIPPPCFDDCPPVITHVGGDSTKTTVSVYTKNGVIRAEDEGSDLYASIDAVADKLERKLRKLKVRVARFPNPDTVVRNIYWQLLQPRASQVHCSARLRPTVCSGHITKYTHTQDSQD